ncbi:MAG: DUF2127 domain-containing protein [Pyrinomonadaceae bacterium]
MTARDCCKLFVMQENHSSNKGIHAIAIFEAIKGVLGIAAGFGLLTLINRDISVFADDLVETLHLNSEGHIAHKIVEYLLKLNPSNIKVFFALSMVYAAVRLIEAYGLWKLRAWAEWFAIISGALYVPIEIYEIFQKPTAFRFLILFINIAIVFYLFSFRKKQKIEDEIHESQIQADASTTSK